MLLKRIINNKIRSMVTQQCKNNNLGINYMIINERIENEIQRK